VIDNYDSFTYNLVQYVLMAGATVDVYRNDEVSVAAVLADRPSHILLSPGPGQPSDSGICLDLCAKLADLGHAAIPLLGVCLGYQALCLSLGAKVRGADRIMHGKSSAILHDGTGIFRGIASPFQATRYHSLVIEEDSLPACLVPVARSDRGELMGIRHVAAPLYGVQFHPESVLSEHGHTMISNFLKTSSGEAGQAPL